ncbi:MAG: right-handed parallel beta-helix repeat-containing protein [Pseudomonadota bacterium]
MNASIRTTIVAAGLIFTGSVWAGSCDAPFLTCIEVNTMGDPTPGTSSNTCENLPGECSFRRAILQANSLFANERPVQIRFNLPAGAANNNAPGTWTIDIDPFTALPGLASPSAFSEPDSSVTIDGASQPGARTNGPVVFINSNNPWGFNRASNTLRNVGFYGGISLTLNNPVGNNSRPDGSHLVENIWMGLDETGDNLVLEDESPSGASGLAGGGVFLSSEANTLRNSVITGAPGAAVRVETEDDNVVTGNYIGTRGDGTVPAGQDCAASLSFDFGNWYGGWGIWVLGGDNIEITNNVIAGLNDLRAPLDSPPVAIRFENVSNSLLEGNVIGYDSNDAPVGTCGGAIDVFASSSAFAGQPTILRNNMIANSRPGGNEPFLDTVIFISRGSALTLENNDVEHTVDAAPAKVIDFSPTGVEEAWRLFEPGAITSINGTSVTGTNGSYLDDQQNVITTPCGGCTVDIYVDDTDNKEEALEWLASTTADGSGNFAATLSRSITQSEGLRTISTANANGVIGSQNRGTSTKMSVLYGFGPLPELVFANGFEPPE